MSTFREKLKAATTPGPERTLPGAVVLAADKTGKIVYHEAGGFTSMDSQQAKPMSLESTMWIASCTKLVTTIAVLQCVEKGSLFLDEDISTVLPELKTPNVLTDFDESGQPILKHATKKLTLRHLLTHSSGMAYAFSSPALAKWRKSRGEDPHKVSPEGILRETHNGPLTFEPGEGWAYGCGIDWAGQMVEAANNGIRLGEYMRTNIWEPLGMKSTAMRVSDNKLVQANLCTNTDRSSEDGSLHTSPGFRTQNPKDDLGGGGMYSCPDEYIRILISLLKNDGTLLKPETVNSMFEPQLPDPKHLLSTTQHPQYGVMYTSGIQSEGWNFGLGGLLNTVDVPGICYKGTMTWSGMPNLYWVSGE
ncbi:MAG: hypothetical protein Q9160_004614 [Pyrenula sp. 1 TL-2023]